MPEAQDNEQTPLLQNGSSVSTTDQQQQKQQTIQFDKDGDTGNPREWPLRWKYLQTLQIFCLALVCPMASSIFAPALHDLTDSFAAADPRLVKLGQAGFVCMLGIGPLFWAPMSETFGRRKLFLGNLTAFTLLQIPTALTPDVVSFVVLRTFAGFFGSVGVANGGGSISDMFETHERATVLGFYLVAPLLGPTIGPLLGGVIVGGMHWRWIFWITAMASAAVTIVCYFFLQETNAVTILQARKAELSKKHPDVEYKVDGSSDQSIPQKIAKNSTKAVRILTTQPIVAIMSAYQALVFSSMYSLYASYTNIWSQPPYEFNITQVGLAYLAPALGFVFTAVFIVLYIDRLYRWLARRNGGEDEDEDRGAVAEYRLAFANIGAVLLPVSLFWFGWTIEEGVAWPVPLVAMALFGASQVSIFNPIQTYYIDAYEANAASALAAGAFLRSVVGGVVPLFVAGLFDQLGYGWGMSVFGFLSLMLMPAPILFMRYGQALREKYPFKG